MDILSIDQLAQLAYDAGFRGKDVITAVSVALAESSGNPESYNPETAAGGNPKSGSRGLWQIYGTAHPGFDDDTLFDPKKTRRQHFRSTRTRAGSGRRGQHTTMVWHPSLRKA